MGEVLNMTDYPGWDALSDSGRRRDGDESRGQIVLFPGVRVERHTIDLSQRHTDAAPGPRVSGGGKGKGKSA